MEFTSTRSTPGVAVIWRRPLTSVSVRAVPRPRRSRALMPAVPMKRVELDWLNVARNCGNWFSESPSDRLPEDRSSAETLTTGTGEDRLTGIAMRDPVTTMASFCGSVPSASLSQFSSEMSQSLSERSCGSDCACAALVAARKAAEAREIQASEDDARSAFLCDIPMKEPQKHGTGRRSPLRLRKSLVRDR